jgi:hypothetical protein
MVRFVVAVAWGALLFRKVQRRLMALHFGRSKILDRI